jgi:hypothetical protein
MCVVMTCMIHVLLRCLISEVLQEEACFALVFWFEEGVWCCLLLHESREIRNTPHLLFILNFNLPGLNNQKQSCSLPAFKPLSIVQ